MTQVTHTQLQNLIDNSSLTVGETYVVTDYPNYQLSMKAESESTLSDESYNYITRDDLVFHYVPATNTVDYMKNTHFLIEGNFDWTSNVSANCYDIHLENSTGLTVTNCIGIYCENEASGTIVNGQYIILGDGCTVDISSCQYLTIGEENEITATGCRGIDIGHENNLSLNKLECCSIEDGNSSLNIQGRNIIGSKCTDVTVYGDSNIIRSNSYGISIIGDCNTIDDSKYIEISGGFNKTDKVSLAQINAAYGNEVENAGQLSVSYTNNNVVLTDQITIDHKEPFVQYQTYQGVKKVKDLTADINLRSDNHANVLIVDEQKMWNTQETKSNKHYVVVDGVWTDVENQ